MTNAYGDLLEIKRLAYEESLVEEGAAALAAYSDKAFSSRELNLDYLGTQGNSNHRTD
jgi:hypothetical protein